jgi:hypothetical protein
VSSSFEISSKFAELSRPSPTSGPNQRLAPRRIERALQGADEEGIKTKRTWYLDLRLFFGRGQSRRREPRNPLIPLLEFQTQVLIWTEIGNPRTFRSKKTAIRVEQNWDPTGTRKTIIVTTRGQSRPQFCDARMAALVGPRLHIPVMMTGSFSE